MKTEIKNIAAALQALALTNSDARNFLTLLSKRSRSAKRGRTTATYLIQQFRTEIGREITRNQAVDLLKALAATGAGKYVLGRRSGETRIEWLFKTTTVGRVAFGGSSGLESIASSNALLRNHEEPHSASSGTSSDSMEPETGDGAAIKSNHPVRVTYSPTDGQYQIVGETRDVFAIMRVFESTGSVASRHHPLELDSSRDCA